MAHDVFISYSSKDKSVADATCAVLEARGVRCWMAPRDILPGSEWGAAIIEAIAGSRVMVLIYTSSSNASPQVKREVERAVARGLHLIPFRVEDVPMSPALEYFISTPHWLDALSPPLERHLDQLSKIIRAVLEAQKPSAPAAEDDAREPSRVAQETQAEKAAAEAGGGGWSHGPPPGAFSMHPPAGAATGAAAGAPAVPRPAPATTVAPAAPKPPLSKAKKKQLAIAGGTGAVVLAAAVVSFSMWSGGGPADGTQPGGPLANALPGATTPRTDAAPSGVTPPEKPVEKPVNPLAGLVPDAAPPAPVAPAPAPVVVAPVPPVAPPRSTEPTEQDVKRFTEMLAEGSPRIPRLQELLDDYPKLADRKNAAGNTPLYEAAKTGQVRVVDLLIGSGADRKAVSAGNNTALHAVAASGLTEAHVVEQLAPGNLDVRNDAGDAPLHVAVKAGHADTARLIAEAGADVNAADKSGRAPVQSAMLLDDAARARATVLALVGAGAKLDVADKRGVAPLHWAAGLGDAQLIGAMIDKGAKVDRPGPGGRTALHLAVAGGKPDAVKLLLARRAAVDAADDQGNTPLHLAAALPDTSMAELLLAGGAKVATATKQKQTALHAAAAAGNTALVELFMRNGGAAVLAGKSPTPVEVAEKAGKKDVALLLRRLEFPSMLQAAIDAPRSPVPPRLLELIRKDPSLVGPGADGRNAVHRCAASGNAAFAAELVKIDPALGKAFSTVEETPLHVAAANRQAGVAKVLLAAGASVRATDRGGNTPLHTAAKAGARDVAQVLLDAGADPAVENRDRNRPADAATDAATKTLLAAAEKDAEQLRSAWSGIQLEGRGFDVRAPGMTQPLRIRFRDRRNFTAEGDVNGTYKSLSGTYTKGALTLSMESPEGSLFPGLPGTSYAGKVAAGDEDNKFGWKVGNAEIQFERP